MVYAGSEGFSFKDRRGLFNLTQRCNPSHCHCHATISEENEGNHLLFYGWIQEDLHIKHFHSFTFTPHKNTYFQNSILAAFHFLCSELNLARIGCSETSSDNLQPHLEPFSYRLLVHQPPTYVPSFIPLSTKSISLQSPYPFLLSIFISYHHHHHLIRLSVTSWIDDHKVPGCYSL